MLWLQIINHIRVELSISYWCSISYDKIICWYIHWNSIKDYQFGWIMRLGLKYLLKVLNLNEIIWRHKFVQIHWKHFWLNVNRAMIDVKEPYVLLLSKALSSAFHTWHIFQHLVLWFSPSPIFDEILCQSIYYKYFLYNDDSILKCN